MKYPGLLLVLFLLPLAAQASEKVDLSVCNDSLFVELKSRDINTLQEREYAYLMQYDKDCNRMKELKLKKEGQKAGQALKMVSSILGIVVTGLSIAFMVMLINGSITF